MGVCLLKTDDYWLIEASNTPKRVNISFHWQYFQPRWVQMIKSVPDRKYNAKKEVWSIPLREVKTVTDSLTHNKIAYRIASAEIAESAKKQDDEEKRLLRIKAADPVAFPVPSLLTTPKPYQYTGILFLAAAKGAILADDMGAGKTLQSLSSALVLGAKTILIVCKPTTKQHWANQVKLHTSEECIVIDGTKKKRAKQWSTPVRFIICGYETVRADFDEVLVGRTFDVVIADETTKIKNHKAQVTKSFKDIKCSYRFALSGTPIENDLTELHSIMDWCQPGLLGSLYGFLDRYSKRNFFGQFEGYKEEALPEIRGIIAPYTLRRLKKDVLPFLPPKIQHISTVEFTQAERRDYKSLIKEVLEMLENQPNAAMTMTLRAKQYTSSPLLLGYKNDGPKLRELAQQLEENKGLHRFLVFSEFAILIRLLAERYNAPCLTGDTPQKDRQGIIDEFNTSNQPVLFSSDVAAYGVEITGADAVIHLDTPWNPAVKDQREDRSHRPGQELPVNVFRFMVHKSIDDGVDRVVARKLHLRSQILDDISSVGSAKLTARDWREALSYGLEESN